MENFVKAHKVPNTDFQTEKLSVKTFEIITGDKGVSLLLLSRSGSLSVALLIADAHIICSNARSAFQIIPQLVVSTKTTQTQMTSQGPWAVAC